MCLKIEDSNKNLDLYLSGMQLDENLRKDTKNTCVKKEIRLHTQKMLTILGSTKNMIGGPIWPLNEQENLHFDNK